MQVTGVIYNEGGSTISLFSSYKVDTLGLKECPHWKPTLSVGSSKSPVT